MGEDEAMTPAERLAQRAAELAARAEAIEARAREAGDVEDELRRLEADLAALDEEERRLDEGLADLVQPTDEPDPVRHDEDGLTGRLGALGDRIADLVGAAMSMAGRHRISDIVERDVPVGEPRRLEVDSFAGSIAVVAGRDDRVHVVAQRFGVRPEDLEAIDVDVAAEADGAVRVVTRSRLLARSWVKLTIEVPPGTLAAVATRGGSVRVDGTRAPLRARTSGGSIKVRGLVGDADVETAGGSIRVEDHEGRVTARTVGGSITAAGRLHGDVDLRTVGGSVEVSGADGRVVASTKGGSIRVRGRLRGACSLDTAGGSIVVELADGCRLDVAAHGSAASTDVPGLTAQAGAIRGVVGDGPPEGELRAVTAAGAVRVVRAHI